MVEVFFKLMKRFKYFQKKNNEANFEIFVKTPTILSDSEIEINEFTDEQIDILNHLDEDKRILITGSQGTGKTSIAEDILKREYIKKNSKILFLNSNRLASEEMKDKLKHFETEASINCYTFNKFLLEIINSVDKQFLKSVIKREFIKKNNLLINKSIEILKTNTNLIKKFNFDFIVFDEMQNCYFYENFYDFMDLILKDGLSNGKYCFLGDFKYQNLVSDQLLIDQNKHPKNYLIDYEQVPLTRNVRNSKSISRNAPILSGLFKNLPYQISKSEHGEVINTFCKGRSEKIERLSSIIRKLKNEGVKGHDIVILSNFRLDNKYNFISELDLSGTYDHVVDLTDKNIRNLGSNIDEIKKKECIYFSTAAAFQGLESKIVVYVDPLETPPKSYSSLDSLKPELIAFNAMGRATTILYLIWDIRLKEYYDKQLKVIGGLKSLEMTKIIKSASETREYLIQELKKQLVGPGMSSYEYYSQDKYNHSNEILDKSPRSVYTAGILFPQGEVNSYHFDEDDYKNENILDENITETKDKSPKTSEDDIEEQVSDNNFDLDLTNELRPSAMGMTILVSNDKPIIIGVNDIGRYNKLGKEPSKQLLMACCYLSKYENSYEWLFEKFKLPKNTQMSVINF